MPIGFIFRILGPVLVALAVFAWGYSMGGASKQRAWDLATAAQVKAQLAATEAARAKEQALQAKVTEANNALTAERQKHARVAAALKLDAARLRDDISKFASGSPEESTAACRDRSATLGTVLESVLSDYRTCTTAAETHAADLRAVLDAWPSAQRTPE